MLPLSLSLFGRNVPTFTALIALAILSSAVLVTYALKGIAPRTRILDVMLLSLLGALIGARVEHVVLAWDHFAVQPLDRIVLPTLDGGLGWHGAVIGAVFLLLIGVRFFRIAYVAPRLLAALAPSAAIIGAAGWIGCAANGCAYGLEVDTLAQFERLPFVVHEARDIFGLTAPRYATPLFGVLSAVIACSPLIVIRHRSPRRLWIALALFALSMFMIGFFRGDSVPYWFGLRADQVLDVWIAGVGFACAILAGVRRR